MAKFTKKIRIAEYDVLKNEFKISFQLAGSADLQFTSTFTCPGHIGFDGRAEQELDMLGFSDADIEQIVEEIFNWIEKPRKDLDGLSYGYTMRTRFDAAKRLKKERRGKAEAERIVVEAPCLDWAMSVTEELVDEPTVVVGGDHSCSPVGIFSDAVYRLANDATQLYVDAARDRIAAMEVVGFGEESVRANINVVETVPDLEDAPSLSEFGGPDLPTKAIDKAVNAIHTHFRRFMTPASLREHDFLRSIIQEEIERVVGGVL
ncbi:hypothetical protein G6K88_14135 [Agrobacterium rhizogenes]|uniref:hypothetical protein n=1 Tax=Rhizobium rhizogenes TaxID=359 RepID=UPI00115D4E6C|nr:hypothetical protein [Rhizobium rhizogenes]NTI03159.1 hypothetical protein [Rhizobium rhizogenes]NTI09963.1 hypothetical protein [Rhizobium rhizogenes]TRB21513.1 hypothetical protein EXN70_21640 [Rhizobium rhizogenes]